MFRCLIFPPSCLGSNVFLLADTQAYSNPDKHGWLQKRGPGTLGKTAFKRRWFVLKNRVLYYLSEPPALGKKPQLIGMIPIDRVLCDDDEDELGAYSSLPVSVVLGLYQCTLYGLFPYNP